VVRMVVVVGMGVDVGVGKRCRNSVTRKNKEKMHMKFDWVCVRAHTDANMGTTVVIEEQRMRGSVEFMVTHLRHLLHLKLRHATRTCSGSCPCLPCACECAQQVFDQSLPEGPLGTVEHKG
jgi:hypothetical protein